MRSFSVSVIIPVYRGRATIGRAVASVGQQSVQPLEIVVVDNEPDSALGDYIPPTRSSVRVIAESRPGAAAARNAGLRAARGDWAAFLDCDDEWQSRYLEAMQSAANRHDAILFAGGGIVSVGDATKIVPAPRFGRDPLRTLLIHNGVTTSASMVSVEAAMRCGGFLEGLRLRAGCEDWALWLKLARNGRIIGVSDALAIRHEGASTPRKLDTVAAELDMVSALKHALGAHPPRRTRAAGRAGVLARSGTLSLARRERREARARFRAAVRLCPSSFLLWEWLLLAHLPQAVEDAVRRLRPSDGISPAVRPGAN